MEKIIKCELSTLLNANHLKMICLKLLHFYVMNVLEGNSLSCIAVSGWLGLVYSIE